MNQKGAILKKIATHEANNIEDMLLYIASNEVRLKSPLSGSLLRASD